ncbi:MAG: glycosyltransferase family 2 protein [Flaviramulus sp.]|nr:glycosyltransferase family A protein [Flaviramulus sp.]NNC50928.1 glycosyltransferase family 2 protein [Flaviramulus sp.]
MIYIIHKNNEALKILDSQFQAIDFDITRSIKTTIFKLAEKFPEEKIIWCHEAYETIINEAQIGLIFHHKFILASYKISKHNFIPDTIGYIDQSVFLNVKKDVSYPTWLMSSDIGGVSSQFLNSISNENIRSDNFDYFLNSMAKIAMIQGLFCYSEPNLLKSKPSVIIEGNRSSNYQLFQFVKQHYKWVWVWMLALCFFIYEKKVVLFPLLKSLSYKRLNFKIKEVDIHSKKQVVDSNEIDVIIPTFGRKKYLHDVLKDLSCQTLLPRNVIIIEQNPLQCSISELDFLKTESWPFNIDHLFTHQTGVCNARNLALKKVCSEWVFFSDDDCRFDNDLIENALKTAQQYGVLAIMTACLQKGEKLLFNNIHQTGIFGSGNSFVKTKFLKNLSFDMALEFGYGEDFDFGMQLRNNGVDIVYSPDIKITHLKAPFGGFRAPVNHLWDNDHIQPKPSPTILYTFLKHYTEKQLLNYKLVLFLRLIRKESIFNYYYFFKEFKLKWNASLFWAKKL